MAAEEPRGSPSPPAGPAGEAAGGGLCLVLCTCPDAESAGRIARALVERRLAACVNVLPGLRSVYRWQGRVEEAAEHLLLIKTREAALAALQRAVVELHPYELPEVVAVPITGGLPAYLAWVREGVREGGGTEG
ncbi:MAG: divalent-cation tolerance protein CutA [Gammaproteobacteria bacterium]|nr:MAG: divalent-cation tolerance protein CutA [Gammaproteobacteria bacterium]